MDFPEKCDKTPLREIISKVNIKVYLICYLCFYIYENVIDFSTWMRHSVNNTISSSHVTTRFINKSFMYLTKIRIYYTNDAENILNTFVLDSIAFFLGAFITPLSHAFQSPFSFPCKDLSKNTISKIFIFFVKFILRVEYHL